MDPSTVWQWRIKFVKLYSRHPEPFCYCKKIGLDFNVGSKTHKKLDLKSATNGAILEICEFAKTLSKHRFRFINHILENSFDLGWQSEMQQSLFSIKIGPRINDLKKSLYKYKLKHFNLASFLLECSNDVDDLNLASSEDLNTDGVSVEMEVPNDSGHNKECQSSQVPAEEYVKLEYVSDETQTDVSKGEHDDDDDDDGEHKEDTCSKGLPEEYIRIEYVSDEMPTDDSEAEPNADGEEHQKCELSRMALHESKNTENVSKKMAPNTLTYSGDVSELKHGILPLSFPLCEKIGVNFEVGSNQRLDPTLVTGSVLLELARASRIVTGSFMSVVVGVLDHNFVLDHKIQERQLFYKVLRLLERYKKVCRNVRTEFEHEPFSFSLKANPSNANRGFKVFDRSPSQYHFKEATKRRQTKLKEKHKEMAVFPKKDLWSNPDQKDGHSYTCPIGESDVDSDEDINSVKKEVSSSLNPNKVKDLETTPLTECFPPVNPNADSTESDSDKEQLFASRPQTPTQTNNDILTENHIQQGVLGTDNLWKLRANRVKQILTMLDNDSFFMSKRFGLNYNVGFGLKQKLNLEILHQTAVLEVIKFTLALNSSQQDFVMEVLEYNFDLELQDEQQRQIFASEIVKRVRQLRNCDDAVKFSKETFELPDLESLKNQSAVGVKTELISVPVKPPDSHVEPEEHVSESSELLYPHCKEIGLKLHVNNNQANTKRNINKLTKGAMIEVGKFAEMLCGTFNQVLFDVLEHNFDVDLQSGHSEVAANILAQIAHIVDRKNLPAFKPLNTTLGKICVQTNQEADSSGVIEQECHINSNADECSAGTSQTPVTDQHLGNSADRKELNDYDKLMWKLRANHIQRMLTIPHLDDCPLYSYSRCKKIGLNFNIRSGAKQNLDPNLLTNGVMAEVSAFATKLQAAQKYFITEILEYNFDLDLSNELCRQVVAAAIFENLKQLKKYRYKIPRLPSLFRLSLEKCTRIAATKRPSCPKCYQDRNSCLGKETSDPDHTQHRPQTTTETALDFPNSVSQNPEKNPSSSFSTTEETIMQSYPRCKKIGLELFVGKNKRDKKLDMQLLTVETMMEVADFAKKLAGTTKSTIKFDLVADVLEHNFNVNIQSRKKLTDQFTKVTKEYDGWAAWFNQVFVIRSCFRTQRVPAQKQTLAGNVRKSERSKKAEKRHLPQDNGQTMAKVPVMTENSPARPFKKNSKIRQPQARNFPHSTKIGLDLDAKYKWGIDKNKLHLNLLTRGVVWEIYKYAIRRVKFSPFSQTVFEILDYNFDISSQYCKRLEFSEATASKVQKFAKQFKNDPQREDAVFKLPFVFDSSSSQKAGGQRKQRSKSETGRNQPDGNAQLAEYDLDINHNSFLQCVQSEMDLFFQRDDATPTSEANCKCEPSVD